MTCQTATPEQCALVRHLNDRYYICPVYPLAAWRMIYGRTVPTTVAYILTFELEDGTQRKGEVQLWRQPWSLNMCEDRYALHRILKTCVRHSYIQGRKHEPLIMIKNYLIDPYMARLPTLWPAWPCTPSITQSCTSC